jgi:uncharacterized protein YjbI with pentapeptide repeats
MDRLRWPGWTLGAALMALSPVPAAAQSPSAPAASVPAASVPAASVPAASAAPDGLPVMMPAGAQFLAPPEVLPADLQPFPGLVAEREGTTVVLGTVGREGNHPDTVGAAVRSPAGEWSLVTVDDMRGYRKPWRTTPWDGFRPVAVAAGQDGFVALGRTGLVQDCGTRCSTEGQDGQVQSLIWFSPDGREWRRIDPRDILGRGATSALRAVMATPDGGWLVAGSTTSDFRKPSRLIVLSSADGGHWRRAATIGGPRSQEAIALYQVGDSAVLHGVELPCRPESTHHSLAAGLAHGETVVEPAQLRLWRSGDGGRKWRPLDATGSKLIRAPRVRSRDCDAFDSERIRKQNGSGAIAGAVDGYLVATDDERTRVSVTSDLEHWTVADLPGATPGVGYRGRGIGSATVVADPPGRLSLLSLEGPRDPVDDSVSGAGYQVLTWSTTDDGATWQRLPATRPQLGGGVLVRVGEDRVLLSGPAPKEPGGAIRWSTSGPLQPWGHCDPAPHADCTFTRLDVDLPGADLTGLDLTAARVGYVDWHGANLTDADLFEASIAATLTGADLDGADLRGAASFGDMTGATLAGADLRGAWIGLEAFASDLSTTRVEHVQVRVPEQKPVGVDLTRLDLSGATIEGYVGAGKTGDLREVDFTGSDLDGASFQDVDLTGARLNGARFTTLTFSDVTCPDGKPVKSGASGSAACRLKAR